VSGLRALVCSWDPPRHDRDAGSQRLWHFLRFLQEAGWGVTYVTANRVREPRYARDLRQLGVALFDGTRTDFPGLVARGRFDLVLCCFWQVAEAFLPIVRRVSPATVVLVDSVDVQAVRDARRGLARAGEQGPAHLLDSHYGDEVVGELNVYAAADGVLAVSVDEAQLIGKLVGNPGLAVWVPLAEDRPPSPPLSFADRTGILFVGSLWHLPNVDALEFACREIVPRVDDSLLERHPLSIVGDGLEGKLLATARGVQHVRTVGWVPSLVPYLERARVSIIPLRYGAGTKQKVIQALTFGTPAVTTSIGAEGLDLRSGEHALIADEPAAFADAIACLLQDEALWHRLVNRGRRLVAGRHDLEAVRVRFLDAIDTVLAREAKPPLLTDEGQRRLERRRVYQAQQRLVPEIVELIRRVLPAGATILVVSDGRNDLLRLEGYETRHFPRVADREHEASSTDESVRGIELLEAEVEAGAEFLLVPHTLRRRLDREPDLRGRLELGGTIWDDDVCTIFDVRRPAPAAEVADEPDAAPASPPATPRARVVAFYVPRFHPIPENDEWWEEGFTDWTDTVKVEPLFPGHYQPHLPADLGFYDLRLPATREAQAELAREAGISAFCYYHYWFAGKRLFERPVDEVLVSQRPDFPFCLCWANEPWLRSGAASEQELLQPQAYSEEDDLAHIRWLIPVLADRRALCVKGQPVFIVNRPSELPDPARTAALWRDEVARAGLPGLYLLALDAGRAPGWDAAEGGFDAEVLFQPQLPTLTSLPELEVDGPDGLRVWDYEQVWHPLANPGADSVPRRRYETVCTGWDTSSREGARGTVLHNSTPQAYGEWMQQAVDRAHRRPPDERLVFLHAWNDWAEGAHLEPDLRHGHAYLDATRRALEWPERPELRSAPPPTRERRLEIESSEAKQAVAVADALARTEPSRARALAFYLPQFHPIPENDEWWGKGFTEWTNVVKARPLFPGHYQPHLPANLGFYDLRVAEVRERQASLAAEHGIEGFCYWHYWFLGRRLLEQPFDQVLASGRPDFPFCLCWANETWSRRWLGEDRDTLIRQEYSQEDDLTHARWLTAAFADPRYIRVRGRPLFLIYRASQLPDPRRTTDLLRRVAVEAGLPEPFLLGINAFSDFDYRTLGYDGTLDFEPQLGSVATPLEDKLSVIDYTEARRRMRKSRSFRVYPSIVVSWDNTPRRGEHGVVFTGSTPETFEQGLREKVTSLSGRAPDDRLLFINAWNEWAEGNHLEPDRKHGLGYLEAVRRVICGEADDHALASATHPVAEAGGTA
jgi:lipopolysaccharide biosynthesis protein/glycosyltransferase involved in cell wall biosynthesis